MLVTCPPHSTPSTQPDPSSSSSSFKSTSFQRMSYLCGTPPRLVFSLLTAPSTLPENSISFFFLHNFVPFPPACNSLSQPPCPNFRLGRIVPPPPKYFATLKPHFSHFYTSSSAQPTPQQLLGLPPGEPPGASLVSHSVPDSELFSTTALPPLSPWNSVWSVKIPNRTPIYNRESLKSLLVGCEFFFFFSGPHSFFSHANRVAHV